MSVNLYSISIQYLVVSSQSGGNESGGYQSGGNESGGNESRGIIYHSPLTIFSFMLCALFFML